MSYLKNNKNNKDLNINFETFKGIERIEEYQTGGINQDIVIINARYFASFCDGETQIDGVSIFKNQPYSRPLLPIGVYEPFIFNDRGNNTRLTILY